MSGPRLRAAKRYLANQKTYRDINAFIKGSISNEAAVIEATQNADEETGNGVEGRLIAIKDNICTTDFPTTAASGILKTFTSPYDATVVTHLRNAGAILAGKTNMDEFGMGSHSTNSHFGSVHYNDHSAGGSSGGSAVAVATEQCWGALGTDTGGSVRLPAAYCGVVGFKPSYGLLSRWGVIAYANSLDTVGVMARSVRDTQRLFEVLNHYDPSDPTSLPPSTRRKLPGRSGRQELKSLRIGVPAEYITSHHLNKATGSSSDPVKQAWSQTLRLLHRAGHTIRSISLPSTKQALSAYYVLAPAEASSNLAKYDGVRYGTRASSPDAYGGVLFSQTRASGFGDEVKRRILLGTYSLSSEAIDNHFIQAQKVRRLVQRDFDRAFRLPNPLLDTGETEEGEGVDLILTPTAPTPPPSLDQVKRQNPLEAYMNDVFTVPASLAGLPALSVPVEPEKGIGMQVLGQFGDDDLVLEAGAWLEEQCKGGLGKDLGHWEELGRLGL